MDNSNLGIACIAELAFYQEKIIKCSRAEHPQATFEEGRIKLGRNPLMELMIYLVSFFIGSCPYKMEENQKYRIRMNRHR